MLPFATMRATLCKLGNVSFSCVALTPTLSAIDSRKLLMTIAPLLALVTKKSRRSRSETYAKLRPAASPWTRKVRKSVEMHGCALEIRAERLPRIRRRSAYEECLFTCEWLACQTLRYAISVLATMGRLLIAAIEH
jgi:hypothetical protein